MVWIPLAQRLPELPLILAGPIVRRVEPHTVTVWVALKEPQIVTLRIYTHDNGTLVEKFSGVHQTVHMGEHLHIVAVTATVLDEQQYLLWGEHYYYNLFFQPIGQKNVEVSDVHLMSPGVLVQTPEWANPLALLVYPGHPLPGFVLPPRDLKRLRIFHGSCRKPHGTGQDMLAALDTLLTEQGEERPHQLYLTGDQIYADDVVTPLLFMLQDAGSVLCSDRQETLPSVTRPVSQLAPVQRRELVRNQAKLTTATPHNHLLSFTEYAMMYLFVWSDTLWPDNQPGVEDLWEAFPELLPRLVESNKIKLSYEDALKRLDRFRERISSVRRVLANIATYMIFDDHDVTDDWYLDGAWCRQTLSNPLGRRVIRNGLLAYALYQAWGNTPEQFADGSGATLLQLCERWDDNAQSAKLEALLNIPERFSGKGELPRSEHALCWHYTYNAPYFQTFVLDTRTRRYYRDLDDFPSLLSFRAMQEQIIVPSDKETELSIIISPAPVLGVDFVETVQFWSRWRIKENYAYDREAWALELEAFQKFLRTVSEMKRVVFLSGDVHYGFGTSLDYWDRRTHRTARMVNFTASALCNEGAGSQMVVLTVGYPRLLRLLRGGKEPVMDFFVWDMVGSKRHTLNYILTAIRRRLHRLWWSIPRLVAARRSTAEIVLPAWGWLRGTFDHFPPDRSYRVQYLYNSLRTSDTLETKVRIGERLWSWVVRRGLDLVTILQSNISNMRSSLLQRIDTHDKHPKLLENLEDKIKREAIETTENLEYKLEKRRVSLIDTLLHQEDWLDHWKAGALIIGYNNIGEIRFEQDGTEYVVVQRLWWYHTTAPDELKIADYRASLALPAPENEPPLP